MDCRTRRENICCDILAPTSCSFRRRALQSIGDVKPVVVGKRRIRFDEPLMHIADQSNLIVVEQRRPAHPFQNMNPRQNSLDLAEGFRRHFQIVPALDAELCQTVFRIRHEVYCRDLGYEPLRDDGLETDEYDAHALYCLLRTADERRAPVGCVRLVLPSPDQPERPFPFEVTCAETLDRALFDPAGVARARMAEVSRLAVLADFRRRKGEGGQPLALQDDAFGSARRPRFPFIPVGLYLGSIALALHHGIDHLFMLTEPRLAAHFVKIGFIIERIGGAVEHRGTRVPSLLRGQETVEALRPGLKDMYAIIASEIRDAYAAKEG